jgi:hypothetical protein
MITGTQARAIPRTVFGTLEGAAVVKLADDPGH